MKKIITLLFCFLFLINISITVYASETSIEEIFPYEAGQMLIDNGFESLDYESILNLDASKVIDYLLNILKSELDTPFVVLYLFFLVIIVVSIISGINGGFLNRELERNISTVGILTVCTTALVPVISCAEGARQFISNISSFNNVFVPALSTVMVMSGQIKTGAGYQAVMLFANEFVSIFITNVVMPLLFFYFAFAIIGKTAFEFNTESISSTIKSSINI